MSSPHDASETAGVSPRTVRRVHRGRRDDIGDLVTRRPLPNAALDHQAGTFRGRVPLA